MSRSLLCAFAALLLPSPTLLPPAPHDWFVAPGTGGGDGSRHHPFHDPWCALAAAGSGDTIHVATGTYFGRYERSAWIVDRPHITLLGGYDAGFEKRDPWTRPTVLAHYTAYEGAIENNLLFGLQDHTGLVVDGFVIDGGGRIRYADKPPRGLMSGLGSVGPLASFLSPDVVIRNCVFVNSMSGGVELHGEGCTFENNIVLNQLGQPGLSLHEQSGATRPTRVKGNTFAFMLAEGSPPLGRGGDNGTAIRVGAAAQIEGNAFIGCGNQGIALFTGADRVAIDRNRFWLGLRANIVLHDGGKDYLIGDKNLGEMEDLGFRSCAGNSAGDLGVTGLDPDWVDGVTQNLLRTYATPPREAIGALRSRYGLGDATSPDDLGPTAPFASPTMACALRMSGEVGAHPVDLPLHLREGAVDSPAASYRHVEWSDLQSDTALDGKPVELRVAVGNERNGFLLRGITAETHLGFDVMYPDDRIRDQMHVFALRNGAVHRQWQDAAKSNNARDAEDWYLLRGIARATGVGMQKMTVQVDQLVPVDAPPMPEAARPVGHDLYVRAGASGGDGSRDKPFRDPFQALAKLTNGDTVHIAGGDYYGKLRSANWKLTGDFVTLLGGYDDDFKVRDPWQHPTRLVMSPEVDARDRRGHGGEFLGSESVNRGLVLDGFVFDGSTVNGYADAEAGGGLDLRASPLGSMVQLRGAGMVIRNCTFANASGIAVDLAAASGTFENNLVVNTSGAAMKVTALGPGPWFLRDNTFVFALDPTPRAGTGVSSSAGSLVLFSGRAEVHFERNLFAFADNYALRVTVPGQKVWMDGNLFAANLFCHVTDARRSWLHDASWQRRAADVDSASLRGNAIGLPDGVAFDPAWLDRVLPRLFALPGRAGPGTWQQVVAATHASVRPPQQTVVEAVATKPDAPAKEPSIDDMLAELRAAKEIERPDAKTPTAAPYAPAYDWHKALLLFQDARQARAGARRQIPGAGH